MRCTIEVVEDLLKAEANAVRAIATDGRDLEYRISELLDEEQRLQKRVQVASRALVDQTKVGRRLPRHRGCQ